MAQMLDTVEVPVSVLDLAAARLAERRITVEKEVMKYGEAPAGIKEVFELCRGFERAYVSLVNESPVAGKVKECFMGDKGLAGILKRQPLEKVFELSNLKQVCRYADGYQPHLVSPEKGMRALGTEALDQVMDPVKNTVQQVYSLLLNAAREAAEKAGQYTESALMGAMPMYVPDFKNVVMPAIVVALDEWKADAEKMAIMLVNMEKSYITAGFFRHTMYTRSNKIKQQQMLMQAQQEGKITQTGSEQMGGAGTGSSSQGPQGSGPSKTKNFFPAFGGVKDKEKEHTAHSPAVTPSSKGQSPPAAQSSRDDDSGDEGSVQGGTAFGAASVQDPNDFVAAYFEKYVSDGSGFSSLPGSFRWQKRFFILSDSQRMLYYFKSPDDVPKPNGLRGQVNVADCLLEDIDEKGYPRPPGTPPLPGEKQFLIRLRHKDPRMFAVKDHNAVILRSETLAQKMEWVQRLLKAAANRPKPPPAPPKVSGGGVEGESADVEVNPKVGTVVDDLSWAKDMEPIMDTHLGEGSRAFRAENERDVDGRLLPAPSILLNPMRVQEKMNKLGMQSSTAAFDVRYDALLEQFGNDMCIYVRMVCDTIVTTVPKSVVHAMIRKSEKNLLERLFHVIHNLSTEQMERLLREEDSVVLRRKQARRCLEDIKQGIYQVQTSLERLNMTAMADRPEKMTLSTNVFAYSAMLEHLTPEQIQYYDKLFSDEYAPDSMKFWKTAPAARMTLPPSAQRQPTPSQLAGATTAAGPQRPAPGAPGGVAPQRPAPGPPGAASGATRAPPPVPNRPAPGPPANASMVRRQAPPPPGR